MTRREMLVGTGSAMAWASYGGLRALAQTPMLKNMGGEPPGFGHRARAGNFDILEHCRGLGLGAVRMNLPSPDLEAVRQLRKKIEGYGMRVIISLAPPKEAGAVPTYDAAVRAVSELGAVTTHASFTARRYEEFDTFEAFQASFERHQRSVELAEPILRKYKVKLAIENHKGWRAAEHVAWIKRVGSEWVGACYDFGNNISLCEDPADTLHLLAPVTIYASFKDMAVEPYDDGFLLSEMALGDGMLDIPGMVKVLQQKDPDMIFALEMITRDPLKIPVFTKKYWATFDDSYSPLPGRDLARILEIVRKTPPKRPLTRTTGLSAADALKLEDELIARSIAWARKNLNLA
ncbi:MAG TPA: TIM barrel protein [Vicinamibacterales bacterium]|nr:TIM barrel protein [Vicinamibacterales bacterium]